MAKTDIYIGNVKVASNVDSSYEIEQAPKETYEYYCNRKGWYFFKSIFGKRLSIKWDGLPEQVKESGLKYGDVVEIKYSTE